MLTKIKTTITRYEKQGKKWVETEKEQHFDNEQYVRNVIDARKFFANLGGYERHDKGYTRYGYRVIRVTSISPDRELKSVYEFDFDNAE